MEKTQKLTETELSVLQTTLRSELICESVFLFLVFTLFFRN